jgi:branched-chain amino acid transport system permease protein
LAAVGGDEADLDGACVVVEGGDGADVVAIQRLDGDSDGGVGGGVDAALDSRRVQGGVGSDRSGCALFDLAGAGSSGLEFSEVEGVGERGDAVGVGVGDEGELLGPRCGEAPVEVGVDVGGFAGQLSLGHAAFFGIGAYTSTLLFLSFNISPWIGMLAGGALAAAVAFAIGYPSFKLRADYFALATIAFAEVVRLVSVYWRSLTGGSMGLAIPFEPGWGNMVFHGKLVYYYIGVVLMGLVILVSYLISKSIFGFYLAAIKEDEDAAEASGVTAHKCKLLAAMISAFITAVCGVYYAQYLLFIEPIGVFPLFLSIQLALIAVIGGIGTVWGPVIGAFLIIPLNELLRGWLGGAFHGLSFVIYGMVLILVVTFMPNGIIAWFAELYRKNTISRATGSDGG